MVDEHNDTYAPSSTQLETGKLVGASQIPNPLQPTQSVIVHLDYLDLLDFQPPFSF